MTTHQENKRDWEEEFEEKFFIESDSGQMKHCDLCGHDHTESGENEGYGNGLKDFIRSLLKAEKEKVLGEIKEGKICLNCGKPKMTDRPDLTDFCYKCLENEEEK